MASVFSFGTALSTVSTILQKMTSGAPIDQKELVKEVNKKYDLITSNGSITKLLSDYIVEPVILATHDARQSTAFDPTAQIATDLFTAFYLQAFQILTGQMDIDARTAVTLLSSDSSTPLNVIKDTALKHVFDNPNIGSILGDGEASTESFNYTKFLMDPKNKFLKVSISLEADKDEEEEEEPTEPEPGTVLGSSINREIVKDLDQHPLYGLLTRVLNVKLEIQGDASRNLTNRTIVIPIIIKAHVIIVNGNEIVNALIPNNRKKSFSYRLDEWRAGSITLSDLLFCSDLIKEYKDVKKKDKNNIINLITGRNLSANLNAARTGAKGFEANYNMLVISSDDKLKIDKAVGGDIYKENYKQSFLTEMHALSCAVLDNDYERMTMVTKDIRGTSDIGFKQLEKRKANQSQQDLTKMMQMMMMNKPVMF